MLQDADTCMWCLMKESFSCGSVAAECCFLAAAAFKELSASAAHSNSNITSACFPVRGEISVLLKTATNVAIVPQINVFFVSHYRRFQLSQDKSSAEMTSCQVTFNVRGLSAPGTQIILSPFWLM